MAHILKAHILALATEPQATAQAAEIVAIARGLPADDREASISRPSRTYCKATGSLRPQRWICIMSGIPTTCSHSKSDISWISTAPTPGTCATAWRGCSPLVALDARV